MATSRVLKFPVPILDEFEITMPPESQPLSVQLQNGEPMMWARCPVYDSYQEPLLHRFHLRGTGHPIDDAEVGEFIDTFQMHGGGLVFHVFKAKA